MASLSHPLKSVYKEGNRCVPEKNDKALIRALPVEINDLVGWYLSAKDLLVASAVSKRALMVYGSEHYWKEHVEMLFHSKQCLYPVEKIEELNTWKDAFKYHFLDANREIIQHSELIDNTWCFSSLKQEILFSPTYKVFIRGHPAYPWGFSKLQQCFYDDRLVVRASVGIEDEPGFMKRVCGLHGSTSFTAEGVLAEDAVVGDIVELPIVIEGDVLEAIKKDCGNLCYISNFPEHVAVRLSYWGWVLYNSSIFFFSVDGRYIDFSRSPRSEELASNYSPNSALISANSISFLKESIIALVFLSAEIAVLEDHPVLAGQVYLSCQQIPALIKQLFVLVGMDEASTVHAFQAERGGLTLIDLSKSCPVLFSETLRRLVEIEQKQEAPSSPSG